MSAITVDSNDFERTSQLKVDAKLVDEGSRHAPTILPFVVATVLQRIGIWFGAFPLSASLIVTPLVLVVHVIQGRVSVNYVRALLFAPVALTAILSYFLSAILETPQVSLFSCLTFLIIYAVFIFEYNVEETAFFKYYSNIVAVVALISIAGVLQYFGQFVLRGPTLFTFRWFVPPTFLMEYNTLNSLGNSFKSNGFFLLEPSALSQLAGRTLLVVWILFPNMKISGILGLGLLATFSGTGMVFTGLFALPVILSKVLKRRLYFFLSIVLIPLVLVFVIVYGESYLHVNYFLSRTSEFTTEGTSGYYRFTSNIIAFNEFVLNYSIHTLFGYGPGTEVYYMSQIAKGALGSCWIKLALEYGLVGLVSFSVFIYYCFFRALRSHFAAFAFLFHYLFLDGTLLVPQHAFVAFFLYAAVCPRIKPANRQQLKTI